MTNLNVSAPLTRDEVLAFLGQNEHRQLSNKVLHGHPSPAFWSESGEHPAVRASWQAQRDQPARINLYFSIPFCLPTDPPHCGFCLFPTEDFRGKDSASAYLDLLAREVDMYREDFEGCTLESLYVGGGTPNLLHAKDYQRLIDLAERLFPGQTRHVEKTLEGIPQLFTRDKIDAIRQAGFNRVSMGVQQLNESLIRYSGRKQTNQQVFQAIHAFKDNQLACNIDLIYGWPEQTIEDMLEGLAQVADCGIQHITHYELNIAGRSDFATRQKALVPSVPQKLQMYLAAQAYLSGRGYVQRTVYDWERPESNRLESGLRAHEYRYEQNLRQSCSVDGSSEPQYMCGLGHAAINVRAHPAATLSPPISTMNHRTLTRYAADVREGRLPIDRVFVHTQEDVRLLWLFQALQEMRVDFSAYQRTFGLPFLPHHSAIVEALTERGWATLAAASADAPSGALALTRTGGFFVPLIQSLIAHSRVRTLMQGQPTKPLPERRIPIHSLDQSAPAHIHG